MSDQRCETCRHWNIGRTDFRSAVRVAEDERPFEERYAERDELERQYGHCTQVEMPPERETGDALPLAVLMDGSDYTADMFTLASFGCALWEEGAYVPEERPPNSLRY